jgi:hypothetical protein
MKTHFLSLAFVLLFNAVTVSYLGAKDKLEDKRLETKEWLVLYAISSNDSIDTILITDPFERPDNVTNEDLIQKFEDFYANKSLKNISTVDVLSFKNYKEAEKKWKSLKESEGYHYNKSLSRAAFNPKSE